MNLSSDTTCFKPLKVGLALLMFLLFASFANAQSSSISLEECYQRARQYFPLLKKKVLIEQNSDYLLKNLSTGYLPQFSIQGQATYQSDVTQIPLQIPGFSIPILAKDQYKVYAEVSQIVIDGGTLKNQKEAQRNQRQIENQQLEVDLYALRKSINQLYFGILLLDQQLQQNTLLQEDIQQGVEKIQSAIRNGTALKSSEAILQAEALKVQQNEMEMQVNRAAYISMLNLFVQGDLKENTLFIPPKSPLLTNKIKRPELSLFTFQNKILQTQRELLHAKNRPKFTFFAQGGAGRPALNMLSNQFDGYYIAGLRMIIPLNGFYTLKNDNTLIHLKQQEIDIQEEVFLFNTQLEMTQQQAEIKKYQQFLSSDDDLIALRASIKSVALAQLENGAITPHDYVRETIAENQARQQKVLHETQLLMKRYELETTAGIDN